MLLDYACGVLPVRRCEEGDLEGGSRGMRMGLGEAGRGKIGSCVSCVFLLGLFLFFFFFLLLFYFLRSSEGENWSGSWSWSWTMDTEGWDKRYKLGGSRDM